MNPLARLICLAVLALPVFTGWPPIPDGPEILPGVSWGPVVNVLLVVGGLAVICGRAFLANAMAVTAFILSPVVFVGGLVSWLLEISGGLAPGTAGSVHGAHYIGLALNMLGVIPLALAIVATIPFDRLEQRFLSRSEGISNAEKYLLMFIRVFNHIVYFVIPNILEVMREEDLLRQVSENVSSPTGPHRLRFWVRRLTSGMIQVGVSGICAAVRFIPLWAMEINDLPSRKQKNRSST